MMSRITTSITFAALSFAACGGGGGGEGGVEPLDCAFVESDNCWKQLVDEIALCAPDPELTGTFSADRSECVYDDGVRVEFDDPVPTSIPDSYSWQLTVIGADGVPCVRWDDAPPSATQVDLQVSSGDDTLSMEGSTAGLTLTCPDGSRFFTDDPLSIITGCSPGRSYGIPVTTIRTAPGFVGLAIALGEEPGGRDIEVDLFSCSD